MDIAINWGAIGVSMLVSVILGFIWYGPLFGKKWMALNDMTMPDPKPGFSVMIRPIIISLVGAFFLNYVLIHALTYGNTYMNMSGISAALMGGFWYWLGFVVPIHLNMSGWENKSWTLFFINSGYWLVYISIAATILTVWA